jgi:hypothetical protein
MMRQGLVSALLAITVAAAAPKKVTPLFNEEQLNYKITWTGGLRVGEAHLSSRKASDGWQFDFSLDASVPGFLIVDRYHAVTTEPGCALEFRREITHGKRRSRETTKFDYPRSVAERATVDGGRSESAIPNCARDALGFLFFARNELSHGRLPPEQPVLAGAAYRVRMEMGGKQPVQIGNKKQDADLVTISVKGPSSNVSFEAFFARDKARTPLIVRCPFSLGVFSLELVR